MGLLSVSTPRPPPIQLSPEFNLVTSFIQLCFKHGRSRKPKPTGLLAGNAMPFAMPCDAQRQSGILYLYAPRSVSLRGAIEQGRPKGITKLLVTQRTQQCDVKRSGEIEIKMPTPQVAAECALTIV